MIDFLIAAVQEENSSKEMLDFIKGIAPIIITVVVGGLWTYLSAKAQKKGERENKIIDQLQEEMVRKNEEQKEMKEQIENLQGQVKELFSRSFEDESYIWELQKHILEGNPPPPPERK